MKIIIPSTIFDIWTTLEVLLGSKLTAKTDSLPKAFILKEKLYIRGEVQNEQQHRIALDKLFIL